MFATIATTSLVATAVVVAGHLAIVHRKRIDVEAVAVLRWGRWHRFVHAITAVCFVVLAVTGFAAALSSNRLEGWMLLAHVVASLPFAIGLTFMAVTWADPCRFAPRDAAWLCRGGGYIGKADVPDADRFDAGQKVFLWITLALGFASLCSMMLATTSWFSQRGLATLYAVHRYSGLGLLIAVILHTYVTLAAKPGTWRAMLTGRVDEGWARRYHRLWWSRLNEKTEPQE